MKIVALSIPSQGSSSGSDFNSKKRQLDDEDGNTESHLKKKEKLDEKVSTTI
jgi:hypothetical protein